MKKNCFIYTVIFGTIILASAIYLIENHFSDLFLDEGKKLIINELQSKWKEDLAYVQDSVEKDSLKVIIKEFAMQFKESQELISSSEDDNLINDIVKSFEDSSITALELKAITELFLKVKNEKLKSN